MIALEFHTAELEALGERFGASERDLTAAYNRALTRTASQLRTRSRTSLRAGLALAAARFLRRRMRDVRLRAKGGMGAVEMWIGRNDMAPEAFRGKPRRVAGGVTIRGELFAGAFIARMPNGKVGVFERSGRARYPIEKITVPVADDMSDILAREVFEEVEEVFWKNFQAELRARTIFGVGRR